MRQDINNINSFDSFFTYGSFNDTVSSSTIERSAIEWSNIINLKDYTGSGHNPI